MFVPEMAGVAEGLHKAIRNGVIPQHQPAAEGVTLTRGWWPQMMMISMSGLPLGFAQGLVDDHGLTRPLRVLDWSA
ncbi:hypothetical protein Misp02_10940 [Microtetraspora sp. NBRC 16547]|nr:hypothetical protein Misp02_10940 [Microtetraspora sp. NBRC 16547]